MTEEFQGVSRAGMGAIFRQIDPLYPNAFPCWFGGELIAGPMDRLLQVSRDLERTYSVICHHPELPRLRVFLEYDEWLLSFVIQRQHYHICDASQWFERVWTGHDGHPSLNSLKRSGLHLPAEKHLGFRTIFDDILDRRSEFWGVELDRFPDYLAEFFGVPHRTRWPHYSAAERAVQWSASTLRRLRFPLPVVVHDRLSRVARRLISRI
jgi:hypothetical protein